MDALSEKKKKFEEFSSFNASKSIEYVLFNNRIMKSKCKVDFNSTVSAAYEVYIKLIRQVKRSRV